MSDIEYREVLGYTLSEAIRKANAYTKRTGDPTFVYFIRYDPDLSPTDRYDWITEHDWDLEQPKSERNIVWSSVDGYYGG